MTINESEFQRERDIAAAWARAEDKVKALELQVSELNKVIAKYEADDVRYLKVLAEKDRLNGELRSLLEYANRKVSHVEPPHTVAEMHLNEPMQFHDNCLRCRIDKALGDVADKR